MLHEYCEPGNATKCYALAARIVDWAYQPSEEGRWAAVAHPPVVVVECVLGGGTPTPQE